jgi:hypothetical protein
MTLFISSWCQTKYVEGVLRHGLFRILALSLIGPRNNLSHLRPKLANKIVCHST